MLAAGAVISIFSVTLVSIYGQTRILFAMGRDGMVPPLFHKLNPRTLTPVPATIIVAVVISLLAGLLPINFLAEMTSIGTLVAFLVVSIGVMVLRRTAPDLPRGFKVPRYPVTPILSIAGCIWIIQDLRAGDDLRLLRLGRRWRCSGTSSTAAPCHARARTQRPSEGDAMTIVVGFAPDGARRAVLHLAAHAGALGGRGPRRCARSCRRRGRPSPARVDAEYRAYLERTAQRGAGARRARGCPATSRRECVVHHARSAPAGLLEVAEQHGATPDRGRVVLDAGGLGHVALGSVSGRLLHSSPLPVALAPRGFRCAAGRPRARVTAAFGGPEGADDLVVAAAGRRGRVGASLRHRLVRRALAAAVHGGGRARGRRRDRRGVERARSRRRRARRSRRSPTSPAVPTELETVVGHGESWDEALEDVEWDDGDVLVVGSSSIGPVARVFLGSRATKIVRTRPSRSCVVPRGAAAELAEEAQAA